MAKILRKTHNPYVLCAVTHSLSLRNLFLQNIYVLLLGIGSRGYHLGGGAGVLSSREGSCDCQWVYSISL